MAKHRRDDDLDDVTLGLEKEARYFRHRAETAANDAERLYWSGRAKTAWRYLYVFTGRAAFGVAIAATVAFECLRRTTRVARVAALTTATGAAVGVTTLSAESIVHPQAPHGSNPPAIETSYRIPDQRVAPPTEHRRSPQTRAPSVGPTKVAAEHHTKAHSSPSATDSSPPQPTATPSSSDAARSPAPTTEPSAAVQVTLPTTPLDSPSAIIADPTKLLGPVLDPVLHPSSAEADPTQQPSGQPRGRPQHHPLLPRVLDGLHLGALAGRQ